MPPPHNCRYNILGQVIPGTCAPEGETPPPPPVGTAAGRNWYYDPEKKRYVSVGSADVGGERQEIELITRRTEAGLKEPLLGKAITSRTPLSDIPSVAPVTAFKGSAIGGKTPNFFNLSAQEFADLSENIFDTTQNIQRGLDRFFEERNIRGADVENELQRRALFEKLEDAKLRLFAAEKGLSAVPTVNERLISNVISGAGTGFANFLENRALNQERFRAQHQMFQTDATRRSAQFQPILFDLPLPQDFANVQGGYRSPFDTSDLLFNP